MEVTMLILTATSVFMAGTMLVLMVVGLLVAFLQLGFQVIVWDQGLKKPRPSGQGLKK